MSAKLPHVPAIILRALVFYIVFIVPIEAFPSDRIEVAGEESYTYGDKESLLEAKQTARTLAIRRAMESYKVFVDATSTVQEFQLIKDLVQTIASGYLHDLKAEESIKGRTVRVKVRGYIVPGEIKEVLDKTLPNRVQKKQPSRSSTKLHCEDFPSQAAAQRELRSNPRDPNGLDRDADGIACERNPPPFDRNPVFRR